MSAAPNIVPKGYRLEEKIGEGGFGVVYRAVQESVGRDVAIKVVLPRLANEPQFIRRFEIEAQLVARLEHPHITPLYDYWRDLEGAYLVMRYFPRGSLKDRLADGPLELRQAADLLDELAGALALAHRNGVVHRDIKPSNVLLDEDGSAYLTDFGIAKTAARGVEGQDEGLTATGAVIGSPDYLAPEQARGSEVAHTSDIYSLGVLMHEVLQGRHPFPDSTPIERMIKHLNESLPPVRDLSGEHADAVNAVLQRATAKSPSERYDSALVMAADFRAAIGYEKATEAMGGTQDSLRVGGGAVLAGGATPATGVSIENPYKGLRAFRAADADHFFGREDLIETLVDRMADDRNTARLLALVGPSGSGKSSALHAGLLPALRSGAVPGSEDWFVVDMVPGSHPLDELEIALTRVAVGSASAIREHLERDERGLVRAAQLALPVDEGDLLIAIDQFEELFTLVSDPAVRKRFLEMLRVAVTDPRSRVRVVLTLRADFFDRPLRYPGFAELLRERIETIVPMAAGELERAIVAPARAVGVVFEEGLVSRIVHDVLDQPGALPLLQYALTELFDARTGSMLTHAAYDQIGGVAGAIARRAEEVYREQSPEAQAVTRQLFLRLVALGEGTEDTRRRVTRGELRAMTADPTSIDQVIDTFADHRLLALDHDPGTREPTVELAHEAILREWARLGAWISDSRHDIRMQRQLGLLTDEWLPAGRDPSFLLRGTRLQQFEAWRRDANVALTTEEQAFLAASSELREREAAEERARRERAQALQKRSQRFLQALVGVMLVATIVAGGAGLWANRQRIQADEQRQIAEQQRGVAQEQTQIAEEQRAAAEAERARATEAERESRLQAVTLLASQAEAEARDGNTDLAVLLALEALDNFPYVPQAERALANAVSLNHALQELRGHELAVAGAAWSPASDLVATAGQDNVVVVWDPDTAEVVLELEQPSGISQNVFDFALAARWSNDARHLYVLLGDRFGFGSQDYHLIRWDAATGESLDLIAMENEEPPEAGEGSVVSARKYWSGDALSVGAVTGRIASLAGNDTAAVWSPDLASRLLTLEGHENDVNSVAWSPDERYLVTSSMDFTARIWHGRTGDLVRVLEGHTNHVNGAVWNADASQIATASTDGTIRIWPVETAGDPRVIDLSPAAVETLAWSPDGETLVVGAGDTRLRLIDVRTGELVASLAGHTGDIVHVSISPDGSRIVSTSLDGVARMWSVLPTTTVDRLPMLGIGNMAWDSDSSLLTIPYGVINSSIQESAAGLALWDAEAQAMLTSNLDPTGRGHFWWSEVAPNGEAIVYLGVYEFPAGIFEGSPAIVLDATTGDVLLEVMPSDDTSARSVEWSPSGDRIATSSIGGTVDVWAYPSGELLATGINEPDVWIGDVSWSHDGKRLATGDDSGVVRIWDAATLEELVEIEADTVFMWAVQWSPDDTRLLSASGAGEGLGGLGGAFKLWDPDTGALLHHGEGHDGDVTWATWSPDGSRFATAGVDDTTRMWDAATGDEIMRLPVRVKFFGHVAWSPDGEMLAIGGEEAWGRVVRVWQSTEELVQYARECCVFRELSDAERERYALTTGE